MNYLYSRIYNNELHFPETPSAQNSPVHFNFKRLYIFSVLKLHHIFKYAILIQRSIVILQQLNDEN